MGSFGNYLGATMGVSENEEGRNGAIFDNSWVTNSNYPQRQALLDSNDGDNDGNTNEFVHVEDVDIDDIPEDPNAKLPRSELLGEVPGLLSDDTAYNKVRDELTGASGLNWETFTFLQLREEKDALKTSELETLATAWTTHGNNLKTASEDFKESVRNAITGKWEGASAEAAEAATQQVTKTSIYDFTPSSDALSNRLTALNESFSYIKEQFPGTSASDLIDDGAFNQQGLNEAINSFNSRYHLDDGGRLRNNSDGYVTAADALRELEEINNSIRDYERAIQLFRDTYNPTVLAVTENFPSLPAPPNMEYGPTGPGPTGPGPTGPGPTGPGPTGPGPTNTGPGGTPPFGTPPLTTPDTGKNPGIPDTGKTPAIPGYDPGTGDPKSPPITPIGNPQTMPAPTTAQGLKSATDAATQGMKSGIDAASQAAKAGQGVAGAGQRPIPSLREGALGLGDKGGPKGMGGGAAGDGSAGAGGIGGHKPSAGLSALDPTSATGARPAVPAASSAGMGAMGGMGAPGMGGAPAGAGGKGADGKEHKTSKALRTRKHGDDIVGDTDAVVPVLGDSEPPPAEENQPAPPRRRIPGQQGTSWQPDSAVQSGPQRSRQAIHPAPADRFADH